MLTSLYIYIYIDIHNYIIVVDKWAKWAQSWLGNPLHSARIYCHHMQRIQKIVLTGTSFTWLVVSTPLKDISQLGWLFPIYRKMKNVPRHQPVYPWFNLKLDSELKIMCIKHGWLARKATSHILGNGTTISGHQRIKRETHPLGWSLSERNDNFDIFDPILWKP